jgi:hypothetical protein
LSLERPVIDKEALINWVGDFLWHFERVIYGESGHCIDDPATIIVDVILSQTVQGVDMKNSVDSLPESASFFQFGQGVQSCVLKD